MREYARVLADWAVSLAVTPKAVVYVMDDDTSMRRALARMIRGAGLAVETRETAGEFLAQDHSRRPACLVLDVHLSGMSGPDLQDRLAATDPDLPIVVVTAYGEEDVRRRMLQAGAIAFLSKPCDGDVLLKAILRGLERPPGSRGKRK